jgi:uncharacterized protein
MNKLISNFSIKRLMLTLIFVYIVYLFLMFFFQKHFVYFPPASANISFDRVLKRDGLSLGAWVVDKRKEIDKALIVFGGNAMALSPWKNGGGLLRCTDRTVFLLPYRGYEGNPGFPDEREMIKDGIEWLNTIKKDFSDVAVWGISLGTGIATAVAATDTGGVSKLLLGTPYDNMVNVAKEHKPWALPALILTERFASDFYAPQIKAPVFILRATNDEIISTERTLKLIESFVNTQVFEKVVPGNHTSIWGTMDACMWLKEATK